MGGNSDRKCVRQVKARPMYGIGAILTILFQTMGLFGFLLWGISFYGWHQLVFYRIVPSFWVFAVLLAVLFVVVMIVQYKILYPALVMFQSHQYSTRDNPMWVELVEIHRILEEVKAAMQRKP